MKYEKCKCGASAVHVFIDPEYPDHFIPECAECKKNGDHYGDTTCICPTCTTERKD